MDDSQISPLQRDISSLQLANNPWCHVTSGSSASVLLLAVAAVGHPCWNRSFHELSRSGMFRVAVGGI